MAITNFIPTVWSSTLYKELDNNYVGVKLSSRDFEGDIKGQGDRVKINGLGPVTVFDYTKNTNMPEAEVLDDNTRTLIIDQAKGFNFFIDSVDQAQAYPKLMTAAMQRAADALADEADKFIYSLTDSNVKVISEDAVTVDNILNVISDARKTLMENNVPNSAKISLEVSPEIEQKLVMANLLRDTDNSETLSRGYVGKILGFDVYVTNNLKVTDGVTRCIARTERAIAFAEQLNSVKAYEPELRHGDAVKGLHLYGGKIIYPKEIVFLDLAAAQEASSI